jgi:Ca2+-transporting ATPase
MTTNMAELVVVLLGLLGVALWNWAIPILAIQILAIDLLAEVMPLTCLTFDPPAPGIMKEPPRNLNAHIMNPFSTLEVILLGTLIGALAFGNFALYMGRDGTALGMDSLGTLDYARATTITYLTIAYCQFVNIMSRRHDLTTVFNANFFSNRILLGSIVLSIVLVSLATTMPVIRSFLYFAPPSLTDLMYILGSAAIFLGVFEGVKLFKRKRVE